MPRRGTSASACASPKTSFARPPRVWCSSWTATIARQRKPVSLSGHHHASIDRVDDLAAIDRAGSAIARGDMRSYAHLADRETLVPVLHEAVIGVLARRHDDRAAILDQRLHLPAAHLARIRSPLSMSCTRGKQGCSGYQANSLHLSTPSLTSFPHYLPRPGSPPSRNGPAPEIVITPFRQLAFMA